MLKRLGLALLLCLGVAGSASAAIVIRGVTGCDQTIAACTLATNTMSTPAVDTTNCGTNCVFVVICSSLNAAIGNTDASDSAGNTYTAALADVADSTNGHTRIFYAVGVTKNAAMKFTCTTTSGFDFVGGVWADGVAQTSTIDTTNSAVQNSGSTVVVPGSAITAAASGELMVSSVANGNTTKATVAHTDGSSLQTNSGATNAGVNYAGGITGAVLSSTSDQVTWTLGGSSHAPGAIALFNAAGAGASPISNRMLSGLGK